MVHLGHPMLAWLCWAWCAEHWSTLRFFGMVATEHESRIENCLLAAELKYLVGGRSYRAASRSRLPLGFLRASLIEPNRRYRRFWTVHSSGEIGENAKKRADGGVYGSGEGTKKTVFYARTFRVIAGSDPVSSYLFWVLCLTCPFIATWYYQGEIYIYVAIWYCQGMMLYMLPLGTTIYNN